MITPDETVNKENDLRVEKDSPMKKESDLRLPLQAPKLKGPIEWVEYWEYEKYKGVTISPTGLGERTPPKDCEIKEVSEDGEPMDYEKEELSDDDWENVNGSWESE